MKIDLQIWVLIVLAFLLCYSSAAQSAPQIVIESPRTGSRIPESSNLSVSFSINSTSILNTIFVLTDTDGDGTIAGTEEIKQITPSENSNNYSTTFTNIVEGLDGNARLIQVFAIDQEEQLGSAVVSVFIGAASGTLIVPPPLGTSTVYQTPIGLGQINALDFSPSRTTLAIADAQGLAASWDFSTTNAINYLDHHTMSISDVEYSADEEQILVGSLDHKAFLIDTAQASIKQVFEHIKGVNTYEVMAVSLSQDGALAMTGTQSQAEEEAYLSWVWDTDTGDSLYTFAGHDGEITAVDIAPAGDYFLSASLDGKILLYEQLDGDFYRALSGPNADVELAAFINLSSEVLAGYSNGQVAIWNIFSGAPSYFVDPAINVAHANQITAFAVSTFGDYATADNTGTLKVWDSNQNLTHNINNGSNQAILDLSFSTTASTLLFADALGNVRQLTLADNTVAVVNTDRIAAQDGLAVINSSGDQSVSISDNSVLKWDNTSADPLFSNIAISDLTAIALSTNSAEFVTGTIEGEGILWDFNTGDSIYTFLPNTNSDAISQAAFSPIANQVALAAEDGIIRIWLTTGQKSLLQTLGDKPSKGSHTAKIGCMQFSPYSAELITGSDDNTAIIWNTDTGDPILTVTEHTDDLVGAGYLSNDPDKFFTASRDGRLNIWLRNNCFFYNNSLQIDLGIAATSAISMVILSPNSELALVGFDSGEIQVWDILTENIIRSFGAHESTIRSLSFADDGTRFISASEDGETRIWKISSSPTLLERSVALQSPVTAVEYVANGSSFITGSEDGILREWNSSNGNLLQSAAPLPLSILRIDANPNPSSDLVVATDGQVNALWNLSTQTLDRLNGQAIDIAAIRFNADGDKYLTAGQEELAPFCVSNCASIQQWEVSTLSSEDTLTLPTSIVNMLTSPVDTNQVLTVGEDYAIQLWNRSTQSVQQTFIGHTNEINAIAFSPDGAWIASGSADRTVILWDVGSGQIIRRFTLPDEVNSIGFVPPVGQQMIIASANTAYIWDTETGEVSYGLGHVQEVSAVSFAPDGSKILTGSLDESARLWPAAN